MESKEKQASERLQSFDYGKVTVTDKRFSERFGFQLQYYMSISVDDMFFEKRKALGLDTKQGKSLASAPGSWFRNGGDVLGQWLQAFSRFYAVTGEKAYKDRTDEMIDAFEEISLVSPALVDGANMYYFEKYLRGFVDAYELCGNEKAYHLARKFLETAMADPVFADARKLLGDNGPGNEIEWYTIAESVLCFAETYRKKEGEDAAYHAYVDFASKFRYDDFWEIFCGDKELFHWSPLSGQNTAYFHAYSHLNSMNSAACFFRLSGRSEDLKAIKNFYRFMRDTQELATGGYGAHLEWLMPKTGIINALCNHHDNSETQCDSYAAYRLSNFLLTETANAYYGNWPEKMLYNMTQASLEIDPEGHVFYYSDYCTQGGKKERHPCTWTCCSGTRPLVFSEITRSVYFYRETDLFVNLLLSSRVSHGGLEFTAQTDFPYSNTYRVHATGKGNVRLFIRLPEWQEGVPQVFVNGRETKVSVSDGWIFVGEVKGEDDIRVEFSPRLRFVTIKDKGMAVSALNYGPVTLAAQGENAPTAQLCFEKDPQSQFERTQALMFRLKKGGCLFKPLLEYGEDEKYFVYFKHYVVPAKH